MKRYKKSIAIHYKYIDSSESETALAEVFDDIFTRLTKKQEDKESDNPDKWFAIVLDKYQNKNELHVDNS